MKKNPLRWLIALLAAFSLVAAACGDDDSEKSTGDDAAAESTGDGSDGPTIKIGAQDFGESKILGEIYMRAFDTKGFDVEMVAVGGFREILLQAYDSDTVNFSAEYAAAMLEYMNDGAGEATGDADETTELLQGRLDDLDLTALEPSPAVDTNAFVVTAETSESEGYEKLSDLPADGAGLTLGAPPDCETNPFCLPGLERVYGIDLTAGFTPLDPGLVADALEQGDPVNIGVLFSTSGRIAQEG